MLAKRKSAGNGTHTGALLTRLDGLIGSLEKVRIEAQSLREGQGLLCGEPQEDVKQSADELQFGVYDCNGLLPVNLAGLTSPVRGPKPQIVSRVVTPHHVGVTRRINESPLQSTLKKMVQKHWNEDSQRSRSSFCHQSSCHTFDLEKLASKRGHFCVPDRAKIHGRAWVPSNRLARHKFQTGRIRCLARLDEQLPQRNLQNLQRLPAKRQHYFPLY